MIHRFQEVQVEIATHLGNVFHGFVRSVAIKAGRNAVIELRGNWVNYVSLGDRAEMTIQIGTDFRRFLVKNAMARLDEKTLSILAETVTVPGGKHAEAV